MSQAQRVRWVRDVYKDEWIREERKHKKEILQKKITIIFYEFTWKMEQAFYSFFLVVLGSVLFQPKKPIGLLVILLQTDTSVYRKVSPIAMVKGWIKYLPEQIYPMYQSLFNLHLW